MGCLSWRLLLGCGLLGFDSKMWCVSLGERFKCVAGRLHQRRGCSALMLGNIIKHLLFAMDWDVTCKLGPPQRKKQPAQSVCGGGSCCKGPCNKEGTIGKTLP